MKVRQRLSNAPLRGEVFVLIAEGIRGSNNRPWLPEFQCKVMKNSHIARLNHELTTTPTRADELAPLLAHNTRARIPHGTPIAANRSE